MKNPHLGQRVWADGLTGTFTVVRINTYQGTADLELTTGTHKIENIPFTAIRPVGYDRRTGASAGQMTKTSQEKQQHRERVTSIVNQLGEEYAAWYGWTGRFGRYVALGEYILEETESDLTHDKWLMDARESFLKWKKVHHIDTAPPAKKVR
jgi:hypothetical protein